MGHRLAIGVMEGDAFGMEDGSPAPGEDEAGGEDLLVGADDGSPKCQLANNSGDRRRGGGGEDNQFRVIAFLFS